MTRRDLLNFGVLFAMTAWWAACSLLMLLAVPGMVAGMMLEPVLERLGNKLDIPEEAP